MPRFLTLSFVVLGYAFSVGNCSLAAQEKSTPLFPTTLNQAIDRDNVATRIAAPWRFTPKKKPAPRPTADINFANEKPRFSVINRALESNNTEAPPSNKPAPASGIHRPERVAALPPQTAQTLTTPPPAKISFGDPSETSDQETQKQIARINQDFATVMSFPAESQAAEFPRTRIQKPSPTQPRVPTNVYRSPPNFELASAKIKKKNNSIAKPSSPQTPEPNVAPGATTNPTLQLSVIGPESMTQDTADDFEIVVTNTVTQPAKNIVVQMTVSEDLTIVHFDRKAWLDDASRTVSWKVDSLPSGGKEIIRFRAVSASTGRHTQNISLGMNNTYQGQTSFAAVVVKNFETEDILQPEFEK